MKKPDKETKEYLIIFALVFLIAFITQVIETETAHATVKGITAKNYMEYVKEYPDAYGYNKGECEHKYLKGEEYFYNDYYDHWNVERIYDIDLIPKGYFIKKGVKAKAKPHKIKAVKSKKSNGITKKIRKNGGMKK